jgi:hypothetical protein
MVAFYPELIATGRVASIDDAEGVVPLVSTADDDIARPGV